MEQNEGQMQRQESKLVLWAQGGEMPGENNGICSLVWQCGGPTCRMNSAGEPSAKAPGLLVWLSVQTARSHGAGMKRWEGGLSGLGILPSNCNKDGLAEGIPFRKILRSRSQTDKTRRQEEGLREKQNKMEELG